MNSIIRGNIAINKKIKCLNNQINELQCEIDTINCSTTNLLGMPISCKFESQVISRLDKIQILKLEIKQLEKGIIHIEKLFK
jgi:dynactin complex subunit